MTRDLVHEPAWPDYLTPPPTLEELMRHAAETDEGMESDAHMSQVTLLRDALRRRYRDRPDVFVGANVPLYYSALQLKGRDFKVPDLMVVLEAEPDRDRPFWIVWEEDGRVPNVVVEVLSPSTERRDRGSKLRIYSKVLGVLEYFIHDLHTGALEGYRLTSDKSYAPIVPDAWGRLPTTQLGGAFAAVAERYDGHDAHWLRLFEPDGRRAPTAGEAGDQRADAETQRADTLAERLEAEAQRADTLAERLEAEAQRADTLAERLAAYERRFGKIE